MSCALFVAVFADSDPSHSTCLTMHSKPFPSVQISCIVLSYRFPSSFVQRSVFIIDYTCTYMYYSFSHHYFVQQSGCDNLCKTAEGLALQCSS